MSAKETSRALYKYLRQSFSPRQASAVFPGLWRRRSTLLSTHSLLFSCNSLFLLYDHLGPARHTVRATSIFDVAHSRRLSFSTTILTNPILINNTMNHDHRNQTLLRPLSIDFTSTPQFDTRSASLSGDPGSAISQVGRPSGTSVRMRDSAGTSMALNIDIHPIHRTPLISGQAITAQGDVLEVHPCGCNNPIASRHNLPTTGSPEPPRGKALFPDPNDPYPSPNSRIYQMPGSARIRTPMVLVKTHLPTPPHATELLQELEIPTATPGTNANLDSLGSPLTPTPQSVRRTQSSSTSLTYQTTPEEPPALRTAPNSNPSSSQSDVAPKLGRMPTQSTFAFDPDLEIPTVLSPSSMSLFSGISEPSAIGPPLSLPSPSSDAAPEHCPCAVLPFSRPVTDVQNQTPTVSDFIRPSSRSAASQAGGGPIVAEVTPPEPEDAVHPANNETTGTHDALVTAGVSTDQPSRRDPVNPQTEAGSTSYLYTDRVAVRLPMPTAMIGPDGEELRHDLMARSEPRPSNMTGRFRVCFLLT